MDKDIISEAVNQIDDDFIEEAAVPSDIGDDLQDTDNNEQLFTAAGVKKYNSFSWQKIAAFAAILFLIAGITGTGIWISTSNNNNNHNEHIPDSSESTNTTYGDTVKQENSSEKNKNNKAEKSKESEKTVTTAVKDPSNNKNTTAPTNIIKDTNNNNNNSSSNDKNITSKKTNQNENKQTSKTTSKASETVTSSDKANTEGKIFNSKILIDLAQKGNALTLKDFADYKHEENGSVWRFFIDEAEGYTLFIGGITKKYPDYIRLYSGNRTSIPGNAEYIDIRESDPLDFMNKNAVLCDALNSIQNLSPDAVQSIRLSSGMYGNNVPLSYDQIKEIISLLKNIRLIDKADGSYRELNGIYDEISIVLHNNSTINIGVTNPYFIINKTPYKAEYEPCEALDEFVHSAILAYKPVNKEIKIKTNEAVCWHDEASENPDVRNINEIITSDIFPGFTFKWIGKEYQIVIEKNGEIQTSIYEPHNAYFADINGDGYPELCVSVTVGSGIVDSRIIVHDIQNNKTYDLSDRGNTDFILFTENNELFVKRFHVQSLSINPNPDDFDKGRLAINDNNIVFIQE